MADATTSNLRQLKASVRSGEEIADSVLDLVGNTPLVRLHSVVPEGAAEILCKLESLNPAGSVKDRIALEHDRGRGSARHAQAQATRSSSRRAATPASAWRWSAR